MNDYRYMTLEQDNYLDENDLWDACDEMVRGYEITNESSWEFFWEMFEGYTSWRVTS